MLGIFGLKLLSMGFHLLKLGVETFLAAATLKAWVGQQLEVNGQSRSRNYFKRLLWKKKQRS
jgi:hypothetical protein